jgi:cysteinyl-tRNA synthetase
MRGLSGDPRHRLEIGILRTQHQGRRPVIDTGSVARGYRSPLLDKSGGQGWEIIKVVWLIKRLEEFDSQESNQGDEEWERVSKEFAKKNQDSMDDDFNTPKVLGAFHELRGEVNKLLVKGLSKETKMHVRESLKKYGEPLGIFQIPSKEWNFTVILPEVRISSSSKVTARIEVLGPTDEWIQQKIRLRNEVRAKKDFFSADTIRKELADQGIILEDRPDGTTRWKR